MYGDIESPCLMPLDGSNQSIGEPLIKIAMEAEDMQLKISLIKSRGNWKNSRTSLMNPLSSYSYAFSRSILITKSPLELWLLEKKYMAP